MIIKKNVLKFVQILLVSKCWLFPLLSSFEFVLVFLGSYLYCGWSAVFSHGGGGHGGGGLDKGGGHLRGKGCGSGWTCGGNLPYQADAAIDFDVRVALSSHVEHFEAVVVESGELALKWPLAVWTTDSYCGLCVEYR